MTIPPSSPNTAVTPSTPSAGEQAPVRTIIDVDHDDALHSDSPQAIEQDSAALQLRPSFCYGSPVSGFTKQPHA